MLKAQNFFPSPGSVIPCVAEPKLANECFVYFEYPNTASLHLKWRLLEASLPEGWDVDLCDYGACYIGIPANGVMNPAQGNNNPYLKLIIQPDTVTGAGWLWFRAIETGQETNFVDVYFSLTSPGTTASFEPNGFSSLRISPNPFSETLTLQATASEPLPLRILDAQGKTVWEARVEPGTEAVVLTHAWVPGIYLLTDGRSMRKLVHIN